MSEEVFTQRRQALIKYLINQGILKSPNVIKAMEAVPREKFLPQEYRWSAYDDTPLPIGDGQTVSAPHMVAIMAEELELAEGLKILEVGSGCGYNAAVVTEIIAPKGSKKPGHLYTIEIVPGLFELAKQNLGALGYFERLTVVLGDGSVGYIEEAPFDRIIVTASAPRILESLLSQLGFPGILLIPVGATFYGQELIKVLKDKEGRTSWTSLGGVAFVPLVGREGWKQG
jgi:protein-L-isoaspartate(D-aspartate) O-methyltransferase